MSSCRFPFPCSPLPLSSLSLPSSVCLLYLALIFMIAHPSVRVESSVLLSIRIRIGIFIALILLPVLFALSLPHFLPLSLSTTPSLYQCVLRVVFYLAWRIKIHKTHFHAQQLPNAERNLYLNAHTHAHSHTTNTPSRQLKFFPFHFPISLVSPSLSFSLALLFSFIERICYSLLLYFYANVRVYCVLLSLCVRVCVCLCVVYVLIVLLNTAQ